MVFTLSCTTSASCVGVRIGGKRAASGPANACWISSFESFLTRVLTGGSVTISGLTPSVDERDSALSQTDPPKKRYRRRVEARAENKAAKKRGRKVT
jgi:hypothetical protein